MIVGLFGAKGMLGKALAIELDARGIRYASILRDTRFEDLPPLDLLLNAAGNSKKYLGVSNPVKDFQDNVESLIRLLTSPAARSTRVVHLSSSEVYGPMNPSKPLLKENAALNPNTNYGFSKKVAEEVVQNYSEKWMILRLGGQYGHGMTKGPIFDILNDHLVRLSPDSTLQLMNTKETAKHILDLVHLTDSNQIFNLANPEILELSVISSLLKKTLALDSELVKYASCLSVEKVTKLITIKDQSAELSAFKSIYSV